MKMSINTKKMFRDHHIETFQFKFELASTNGVVTVLFCSVITVYLFTVPNRTYDKSKWPYLYWLYVSLFVHIVLSHQNSQGAYRILVVFFPRCAWGRNGVDTKWLDHMWSIFCLLERTQTCSRDNDGMAGIKVVGWWKDGDKSLSSI